MEANLNECRPEKCVGLSAAVDRFIQQRKRLIRCVEKRKTPVLGRVSDIPRWLMALVAHPLRKLAL